MKGTVESRVKNYEASLKKFEARWNQLKPKDAALDGGLAESLEAVKTIQEKKAEFDEIEATREALVYAIHLS